MALQYGTTLRNGKMNSVNTTLGATAILRIFSGAVPANCAAADPSGLLATINLPATPFNAASAGAITKAGTWSTTGSAAGVAASWRIYDSGVVCQMQGNCSTDLVFNNTNIAVSQPIEVTTFTLTSGNA